MSQFISALDRWWRSGYANAIKATMLFKMIRLLGQLQNEWAPYKRIRTVRTDRQSETEQLCRCSFRLFASCPTDVPDSMYILCAILGKKAVTSRWNQVDRVIESIIATTQTNKNHPSIACQRCAVTAVRFPPSSPNNTAPYGQNVSASAKVALTE